MAITVDQLLLIIIILLIMLLLVILAAAFQSGRKELRDKKAKKAAGRSGRKMPEAGGGKLTFSDRGDGGKEGENKKEEHPRDSGPEAIQVYKWKASREMKICPNCEAENEVESRKCISCGFRL